MKDNNKIYSEAYLNYQLNRGKIRKIARRLFLNNLLKYIEGKTIDLGCGVGELLRLVEKDSVGYEVNSYAVNYCQNQGLNVREYDPIKDDYKFKNIKRDVYKTLIMCHVLEHLKNPKEVIKKLLKTCDRLDIKRAIIVVPGKKGFESDVTHQTYINEKYFKENNLELVGRYKISIKSYFPFNFAWAGNLFTHNELIVIYERKN